MNGEDIIGWSASAILILTLGNQVLEQWRSGNSKGVSPWLFVGQLAASIGFCVYSILLRNWVFVVTNALLVCNAILGQLIVLKHRRRQRRAEAARTSRPDAKVGASFDARGSIA